MIRPEAAPIKESDEVMALRAQRADAEEDEEVDRLSQAILAAGGVPDWVHCVGREDTTRELLGRNLEGDQITWCSRRAWMEFIFVDATHALINGAQEGRLQTCPGCAKAIAAALEQGTWER